MGQSRKTFGAEVDRGQWLIPPESSRRDGVGKRDRDVLYEGKQREREKGTQPNLRVHLSGGSSLSNCPCSTSCIKEAFNELEAPAITLHLPPD